MKKKKRIKELERESEQLRREVERLRHEVHVLKQRDFMVIQPEPYPNLQPPYKIETGSTSRTLPGLPFTVWM